MIEDHPARVGCGLCAIIVAIMLAGFSALVFIIAAAAKWILA